jgi:hypothetical protein
MVGKLCGVIDEGLNIQQRKEIAVHGPAVQVRSFQNQALNGTFQLGFGNFLNSSWPWEGLAHLGSRLSGWANLRRGASPAATVGTEYFKNPSNFENFRKPPLV